MSVCCMRTLRSESRVLVAWYVSHVHSGLLFRHVCFRGIRRDIKDVLVGKKTTTWLTKNRRLGRIDPDCCFAVVTPTRIADFVASSPEGTGSAKLHCHFRTVVHGAERMCMVETRQFTERLEGALTVISGI